jgi:hypothetical protein
MANFTGREKQGAMQERRHERGTTAFKNEPFFTPWLHI